MNRAELLEKLRELKPWLAEQGIGNPRLYGSFARDEAGPDSDVDLLVELTQPLGLEYFGIMLDLADRLGRRVEFATEKAMNPLVRERIRSDLIPV
jgi:predicted nucleotidyltransferase